MESIQPTKRVYATPSRRKSVFMEVGLVDEDQVHTERSPVPTTLSSATSRHMRPARTVRFRSKNSVINFTEEDEYTTDAEEWETDADSENDEIVSAIRPWQTVTLSKISRLGFMAFVLALLLPFIQLSSSSPVGVNGGAIPRNSIAFDSGDLQIERREDSDTNVCRRWSGQCRRLFCRTREIS